MAGASTSVAKAARPNTPRQAPTRYVTDWLLTAERLIVPEGGDRWPPVPGTPANCGNAGRIRRRGPDPSATLLGLPLGPAASDRLNGAHPRVASPPAFGGGAGGDDRRRGPEDPDHG